jgi:hypothetical protein
MAIKKAFVCAILIHNAKLLDFLVCLLIQTLLDSILQRSLVRKKVVLNGYK